MSTQTIALDQVRNLVYNGVDLGHSKLMIGNTRVWEKYITSEAYEEWVESGHYETTSGWVEMGSPHTIYRHTYYNSWWYDNSGSWNTRGSVHHAWYWVNYSNITHYNPNYRLGRSFGTFPGPGIMYKVEEYKTVNTWVDTSSYVTKTRDITAYYY